MVAGRLVLRVGLDGARGVAVSRDRVDGSDSGWHTALVRRNGRRLYVR